MQRPKQKIAEKLAEAQLFLNNASQDPFIAECLAAFGYDTARINQGFQLYQHALEATRVHEREYARQYAARDQFLEARRQLEEKHRPLLKIARIAFQDDRAADQLLHLSGRRKREFALWLNQLHAFYSNVQQNNQLLEGLGEFNVTHGQIEEVVELLRAVEETWYGYEREKGNAQAATKARDAAVAELNTWMRNARPIARIAVAEQPQLLEKLGILVRS
jgi:hypothetical protein